MAAAIVTHAVGSSVYPWRQGRALGALLRAGPPIPGGDAFPSFAWLSPGGDGNHVGMVTPPLPEESGFSLSSAEVGDGQALPVSNRGTTSERRFPRRVNPEVPSLDSLDLARAAQGEAAGARPIRVCMVSGPGGAELDGVGDYVEQLAGALGDVGVRVTTVPVSPDGGPEATRWWRATWRTAREVGRVRPDLVHVQFAPAAFRFSGAPGALPLLLRDPVPLVVTVHEYGSWSVPSWVPEAVWRAVERTGAWDRETGRLVPSGSAVIVTNADHAGQVRARTGRRAIEVPLAPNVADHGGSPDARRRTRDGLGLSPEDLLLVFFGFVHPVKGVRYLLEALATLRTRRPGIRLLVAGGFTSQALPEAEARHFRADLERLAHRYGVAGAVTFTGYLPAPDASRMLNAADIAVLPYTAGVTAKSGALLTTLAHGLPTAVTAPDEPGRRTVPDCVEVIPARRDATAIARAVERLAADPALRRRLAAAGREFAARHSWPRVAAAHRALYDELLAHGHRRGGVA